MVVVPDGVLAVQHEDDGKRKAVQVPRFCLDRTEVTVRAFAMCVAARQCKPSATSVNVGGMTEVQRAAWSAFCNGNEPSKAKHPVNCVDWEQAHTYCAWAGKRLPSDAEWEYGARGADGRLFPWGNSLPTEHTSNLCDLDCRQALAAKGVHTASVFEISDGASGTNEVGSYPTGVSPFGALDMAGNVFEWTADWMEDAAPDTARSLRGGGWYTPLPEAATATVRHGDEPQRVSSDVGFRCADSVQ